MAMTLLDKINSPLDLRKLDRQELPQLAQEGIARRVREFVRERVSERPRFASIR
jgi:deoxyxylulose-5-phosphate synthase